MTCLFESLWHLCRAGGIADDPCYHTFAIPRVTAKDSEAGFIKKGSHFGDERNWIEEGITTLSLRNRVIISNGISYYPRYKFFKYIKILSYIFLWFSLFIFLLPADSRRNLISFRNYLCMYIRGWSEGDVRFDSGVFSQVSRRSVSGEILVFCIQYVSGRLRCRSSSLTFGYFPCSLWELLQSSWPYA